MVMHARKPQRMNDGYFEKHASHTSYQSSKYTSSKREYERERSSNYRDRELSPGGGGGGGNSGSGSGVIGGNGAGGSSGSGGGGSGGGPLNNGNSYRSQSPDIDSPSSRSHDIRDRSDHRGGGGGRGGSGERYSFIQKMRDRDRDVYKKDKYSDKRDRRGNDRDSESSYRTNHDRDRRGGGGSGSGGKLCSSRENDKRSGSDDRDRDRDRDMRDLRDKRDRGSDRDRDLYKKDKYADKRDRNDRGERTARYGDWSEHVSSSGKMYYYNCKTEISQWEKPKEWVDRERNLPRDQHREKDYRDKDRDRDRDDRFSRSTYKHSNSSRASSRLRWNYDNDGPPSHRRRLDGRHNDNADMDISGDSTPTSEASYSLSGTPTAHGGGGSGGGGGGGSGGGDQPMGNALPRLSSHPNASSVASIAGCSANALGAVAAAAAAAMHYASVVGAGPVTGATMLPTSGLSSVADGRNSSGSNSAGGSSSNSNSASGRNSVVGHIGSTSGTTVPTLASQDPHQHPHSHPHSHSHPHHLNSNAPLPPGAKGKEQALLMRQKMHLSMGGLDVNAHHGVNSSGGSGSGSVDAVVNHGYNSVNNSVPGGSLSSLRDNSVNSPLYMPHSHHSLSPSLTSYAKSPIPTIVGHTNNVSNAYSCSAPFGLKSSLDGGLLMASASPATPTACSAAAASGTNSVTNIVPGLGPVSGISVITSMGSNSVCGSNSVGQMLGEGPPTPTQELDLSGMVLEHQQAAAAAVAAAAAAAAALAGLNQQAAQQRAKLDCASAANLSTLQSCVGSSVQAGNLRGPEISPKLAKYFRADLIAHVTNWQAEVLERQAQKCCEDTHLFGDITCTRICAELKCARSLVRSTEINATLQEQKIMYLRQQIRRIEESKTQNAFMSDDT